VLTGGIRVNIERVEILCGERPDLVSPAELWLVLYTDNILSHISDAAQPRCSNAVLVRTGGELGVTMLSPYRH
jgi:hypothetical protein